MPVTRSGLSSYTLQSVSPPNSSRADAPQLKPNTDVSIPTRADAPQQELVLSSAPTAPLDSSLSRLDDNDLVQVRDAKELRDAASTVIKQVWNDACSRTSALATEINEGNLSLTHKLNESFTAVGDRLDSLPVVAMLGQDVPSAKISPYTGSEDGPQFSIWLRRLEDIIRMRPTPLPAEHKAYFLIGHLDGVAREQVEELDEESRKDFSKITDHLRATFENPQHRYLARQKLTACKQVPGESSSAFADKILNLVRAATAGQDASKQKEKALEEFTDRLRSDIRYHVKLANPTTFEQAVTRAREVEQIIAEAAADRLLNFGVPTVAVNALARASLSADPLPEETQSRPENFNQYRSNLRSSQRRPFQVSNRQTRRNGPTPDATCFNCGGRGHFQNTCSTPARSQSRRPRGTGGSVSYNQPRRSYNQRESAQLMACDVLPSPSDENPLQAAQSRISELSLTVNETKAQLDQSQARVAALMKRNDELAQTAFDNNSPVFSRSCSSPDVKCLLVGSLMLSLASESFASSSVWLCPNENPTNLLFVPQSYNCSGLLPNSTKELLPLSLQVFRPNTKRYSSAASYCRIVKHSVTYSVSFFGARAENHIETLLPVSPEECRVMAQYKRCKYGDMSKHGNTWRSSNVLSFEFPSAPFGCCHEHHLSVHNCYLTDTTVYARHGEETPESAVGDMRTCRYKDGLCTMSDGSICIWSPDAEEECRFVSVSKMKGFLMGNVWISESKEFALSWSEKNPMVSDCWKELTITDQGYAIAHMRRMPRTAVVGVVTSNQLSAQLLAVEGAMQDSVATLFRHAIQAICERTNMLAIALHAALRSSPTLAMRSLVGREDISATHVGNGFVQIRRCVPVPTSAYHFLPFNGTCFQHPRIELNLRSGSRWRAFLNPSTGIVVRKSAVVGCDEVSPIILSVNSTFIQYSPLTGRSSPVDARQIQHLFPNTPIQPVAQIPPLTIFHNLVLTNFTEILADAQLEEMWTARDGTRILDHISQFHVDQQISTSSSTSPLTLSFAWPPFRIFDIWVFICCLTVSLGLLKSLLIAYFGISYPGLLPLVKALYGRATCPTVPMAQFSQPPNPPASVPSAPALAALPCAVPNVGICKVDISTQDVWPPRASIVPISVLATTPDTRFFVAQIPVQVNGVRLLALIDTGAGITVASKSLLPLLGVFKLEASEVPSAVGMAGVPVQFVGCAILQISIGSEKLQHKVHFTATQCVPTHANAYNMILGNDALRRLPTWSVDYKNRIFHMGQEQVHILTCTADTANSTPTRDASVRAAETSVLRAGTESLVRCYTQGCDDLPVAMVSAANVLENGAVYVAPAVFNRGKAWLSVTNPSEATHVLFKDQKLTSANPLVETGDGTLYEPSEHPPVPVLRAEAVEFERYSANDPVNCVDLSQAEVSDDEKRQLQDLFAEYSDRISHSSYDLGSYEMSPISIKTTTDIPPTRYRPTRIPTKFQKELDDHINRLLRAGRIVESDTPWVHNTVLVRKKDGSLRVCLDFRPLNEVTVPDHYPLPRIEDLLEKVAGNRFYTTIDLASGYMQLLLDPASQEKCGWTNQRPVFLWIVGSHLLVRAVIQEAAHSFQNRSIAIRLVVPVWSHAAVMRAIRDSSAIHDNVRSVEVCVKLGTLPSGSDPVYEIISSLQLFQDLSLTNGTRAGDVLDTVYGRLRAPVGSADPPRELKTITIAGNTISLRQDQANAIHMGEQDLPILAIQAAFGTGKTVVSAVIAARVYEAHRATVIATTTTNNAVAQFTDTLMKLDDYKHLDILRFASDSALQEGAPQTEVDMHTILKRLVNDYGHLLDDELQDTCNKYKAGRELLENFMFNPESAMHLSEAEREQYRIAERDISQSTKSAVAIMFKVRPPAVVCMTTSALLNSVSPGGIFHNHLNDVKLIIGDEASQIPEPAMVAIATRLPGARHIYVGDIHQLEPHIRCSRSSNAARFGAQGVMDLLLARGVPSAPLVTTFRAHPALNDLLNTTFYDGILVNGTSAADRRMLLTMIRCPNPSLPFVFVDVRGSSQKALSGSHFNSREAEVCRELVLSLLAKDIKPSSIAIVVFYKEQYRLLERFAWTQQVDIHTVDSVQGREKDIVILLTTRTNFAAERAEFLDDPRRLNVSLSRCRHGQFVLGHASSLQLFPNWKIVIDWSYNHGAVSSDDGLPDLLE